MASPKELPSSFNEFNEYMMDVTKIIVNLPDKEKVIKFQAYAEKIYEMWEEEHIKTKSNNQTATGCADSGQNGSEGDSMGNED